MAAAIPVDSVRDVALRFQIGEAVFHTWKPRLALVYHSASMPHLLLEIRNNLQQLLPPNADGVIVRGLPAHGFSEGIHRYADAIQYVSKYQTSHLVEIDGQFDAYLAATLTTKSRQNITRAVRKFKAQNQDIPFLEVFTEAAEMPRFLAEAAEISSHTFQSKLLGVGLADTPGRQSHLQRTAAEGDARGYVLRLQGKAIAFAWCRQKNNNLIYDVIGYLPDQAHHSPGTVLLYLILEDLFNIRKYEALDFGSGQAHYKSMFSTREELLVDAFLFRRTYKNRLLTSLHHRMLNLSIFVSKALDQLGLKAVVKKVFRALAGGR
jgi:CelD/BcsL family acetyltransferase involved in cellulose biosynthesis